MKMLCQKYDVLTKPLYMLVVSAVQGFCVPAPIVESEEVRDIICTYISAETIISAER